MDIIDIIKAYNPWFDPADENVIMVPVASIDDVMKLAKQYGAKILFVRLKKSKYAYVRWYYEREEPADEF